LFDFFVSIRKLNFVLILQSFSKKIGDMGTIVSNGSNWVLTIPKMLISDKEIQKILDLMQFYDLVKDSEMTEPKAWELSEDIKEQWWADNKDRIMAKIAAA
jgi:hypothetical protein